jgi:DNA-binding NtrC family response regulator
MTRQGDQPGNFPSGTGEGEIMQGLLIVDEDMDCRKQMADMFIEAGYNVIVTNSVANALYGILKKTAQVVLLGTKFDELTAADLIPLLKQCNRKLTIILVAADTSLPLIRKLRAEGIFYHALKPVNAEDREEIRQAVHCAFENLRINPA